MVTVYGQPGCVQCKRTVKKLEGTVDYKYIDVSEDSDALAHIKALGYQSVPVIEANGEHWNGYVPEKLASLK
jgi:glutaredoxin-like protein NrdH